MKTIKEVEVMLQDCLERVRREIVLRAGDKFASLQSHCQSIYEKDAIVNDEKYELQNWYGTISITDKALRGGEIYNLLQNAIEDMIINISARMRDGTYLIDCNKMCLYELCDWSWLADDDGSILRREAGRPFYTATLVKYAVIAPRRAVKV